MIHARRDDSGRVLELQLARPPANALNAELLGLLERRVQQAADDGASAIVLSGLPGIFSAGLDIPELLALDAVGVGRLWRGLLGAMRTLAASPVPVVAAITGHAPAGGAVLALCCDYRVMAEGEHAIGLNEVAVGIPLPRLVFELLARTVGRRHAERWAVSGRMSPPAEALAIGLVDELAPPAEVVARAVGRCQKLLRLPTQAMLETRAVARADLVEALAAEDETVVAHLVEILQAPETRQALESVAARLVGGGKKPMLDEPDTNHQERTL